VRIRNSGSVGDHDRWYERDGAGTTPVNRHSGGPFTADWDSCDLYDRCDAALIRDFSYE